DAMQATVSLGVADAWLALERAAPAEEAIARAAQVLEHRPGYRGLRARLQFARARSLRVQGQASERAAALAGEARDELVALKRIAEAQAVTVWLAGRGHRQT